MERWLTRGIRWIISRTTSNWCRLALAREFSWLAEAISIWRLHQCMKLMSLYSGHRSHRLTARRKQRWLSQDMVILHVQSVIHTFSLLGRERTFITRLRRASCTISPKTSGLKLRCLKTAATTTQAATSTVSSCMSSVASWMLRRNTQTRSKDSRSGLL